MLIAIGKYILSIDLNKVQQAAPVGGFTTEKPAVCHMDDLIEGISKIGEHEEDVTDLAIPSYPSGFIASSAADGLVRYFNSGICLCHCTWGFIFKFLSVNVLGRGTRFSGLIDIERGYRICLVYSCGFHSYFLFIM